MTNNGKITKRDLIPMILIGAMVFWMVNYLPKDNDCGMSRFNTFSNDSRSTQIGDRCFVPTTEVYTSTEKCGFLGIRCRDVPEHYEMSYGTVGFNVNTGERC